MITQNAANVAINIAQEFDRRRLVLTAEPGSPLATLVASSCLAEEAVEPGSDYEPNAEFIESLSSGFSVEGVSRHDEELTQFATDIGAAVAQHLNFARNVVRPVIQQVAEGVEADIKQLPAENQHSVQIIQRHLAEPLSSASFRDTLSEYQELAYEPVRTFLSLPDLSPAEIVEQMLTGASETDELIRTWAARKGDAFLLGVFNAVFTANEGSIRFEDLINDQVDGTDAALVVFLLAHRLLDNPPENVPLTLADYNSTVALLRNQAGLRLVHGMEVFEREVRAGQLVLFVQRKSVTVNAEVYAQWIAEGGTNAILFGNLLTDRPVRYVSELTGNATEFKATWERENRLLTSSEHNNRFARYKQILRDRALCVIGENMGAIFSEIANGQEITTALPEYVKAAEILDAFIDAVDEDEFKEPWILCTKLVCRSVFFYTDAEKILLGIDRAVKNNPGIEIREAALISTIEYVTDYLCDQLSVKSV